MNLYSSDLPCVFILLASLLARLLEKTGSKKREMVKNNLIIWFNNLSFKG